MIFGVLESVVGHLLDKVSIPEVLSLLPEELLRVIFTDFFFIGFK